MTCKACLKDKVERLGLIVVHSIAPHRFGTPDRYGASLKVADDKAIEIMNEKCSECDKHEKTK